MQETNPKMTCLEATKTTILSCGDVEGVRYCRKVVKEETVCVPDGADVWQRLALVIKGLSRFVERNK